MLQANQPFFYSTPDGVEHYVAKGSLFGDKDAAVKGRESLFDVVDQAAPAKTGKATSSAS